MLSTIISYGVYLGEVFVRNVPGASWGPYTGDDLLDLDIRIDRKDHSFVGYPLKRVLDFWFDRSLVLSVYYQMNLDMLDDVIQLGSSAWKDCDCKNQNCFSMSQQTNEIFSK